MKDYSQIVTKVTSTPWMITPEALRMMLEILDARMSGQVVEFDAPEASPLSYRVGSVGVLNLSGPIFPKANMMTDMSGATSLQQFRTEFGQMMNDPSVRSILLDVDSPGGLSDMVDEMASEIYAATQYKPIISVANTAANSAAYYLASQANKMYVTPSGQVGSIGTFVVHTDDSKAREQEGVDRTIIKAGRFKAIPLEPLTSESRDHLQSLVNNTNDKFVTAVANGRNVDEQYVRENFGEGGVVSPEHALEHGMVDGIATFDEVLADMSQPSMVGGGVSYSNQTGTVVPMMTTSDNTGNSFKIKLRDISKEHSEPGSGTGGEPTPRESPNKDDKAIEGGWRRDPPPIAYEEQEESAVTRAWMEERATVLGIDFDTEMSDDDLASAIEDRIDDIVVPLNTATADVVKQREFAEAYPEQAKLLAALSAKEVDNAAHLFAEGFARFDGEKKGYSTLVREKIEQAHKNIALRQFSQDDLNELLTLTASKEAVVEWGESGSSREAGQDSNVAPTSNFVEDRKMFAELVKAAMTEDNLSQQAAIAHVSQQNPELAQAYLTGHVK
jgi:signal peptide peptidase SppA